MAANVAPGFEIELLNEAQPRTSKKFRRVEYNFDFGITHNMHHMLPNLLEASNEISSLYENMVKPVLDKYSGDHKYCVFILHKGLKHKPIFIGGSTIDNFDSSEFLNAIYKVSQSNEDFLLTGELKVTVTVKLPEITGSGRNRYTGPPRTREKRKFDAKSLITIKNNDCLCGYRAVYVGIMFHEMNIKNGTHDRRMWDKVKGLYPPKLPWNVDVQRDGALTVCTDAQLQIDQPLTLSKMQQLQDNYLSPEYQLIVVDGQMPDNLLFKGTLSPKQIYIEYDNNHYNTITNMHAYLMASYYCVACNTPYQTTHKCKVKCQKCGSEPKCTKCDLITCDICGVIFYNYDCFEIHKISMCQLVKQCSKCEVHYNAKDKHICDQTKCVSCGEIYSISPHYCYLRTQDIQKLEKDDKKIKIIVCYDIESTQVQLDGNCSEHKPILLIAEIVCDKCWDINLKRKLHNCDICGEGYKQYFGVDCIKEFGNFIYTELAPKAAKLHSKVLVFAHNSSGYDGHFVFRDVFKRNFEDVNIILNGLKVLLLDVANVRFIDSLSFFQQPLAQLPKSFGVSDYAIKGWFPHLFSKPENFDYIGNIRPLEEFGIKYMKKGSSTQLRKWHSEMSAQQNYVFNYKQDLIKYCANDVKILTMSIMIFRELFKSATRLDPTTRNFTLASVGFEYFRALVLSDYTIGICPVKGYSVMRNQSKAANIYIDYLQKSCNFEILREQHIGKYFADGFISEEKKIIEFFGCKWHGCNKCEKYKVNRDVPLKELNGLTYDQAYQNQIDKLEYFRRRGFEIHYIWECEAKILKDTCLDYANYSKERSIYYKNIEIYGSANIRDSFFGGRTNNLYFTYDCDVNEKIACLDFTSLYPHVLVSNFFPVGHPKVIKEFPNNDISNYFGFIKCVVLPPKQLYLGVLPARVNKKLYFPLCKACAESQSQNSCTHTDEERCLVGTWTSVELQEAVKKGYIIKTIIQVLNYELKSDKIFQHYIRTWLKIKTEASGWPKNCTTQELKDKFIADFEVRERVKLDPNNMIKNEGLRYIAKLMLNTLWGKLGQNTNQVQTKICNDYNDYATIENDPSIVIKGEFMATDNVLVVNYKYDDEIHNKAGNTSPAIASFVTSYARLKLFRELDKIETSGPGRVLYFDTDSIYYAYKTGSDQYTPTTGDFLGDFTDEIWKEYETEGAYISSFASSGPKNYGYQVSFPDGTKKSKSKVKGITLTDEVDKILDFDVIYKFAKEYADGIQSNKAVPQMQFRADMHHNVFTNEFDKRYRVVSEKRRQIGNKTLPFGYVN